METNLSSRILMRTTPMMILCACLLPVQFFLPWHSRTTRRPVPSQATDTARTGRSLANTDARSKASCLTSPAFLPKQHSRE